MKQASLSSGSLLFQKQRVRTRAWARPPHTVAVPSKRSRKVSIFHKREGNERVVCITGQESSKSDEERGRETERERERPRERPRETERENERESERASERARERVRERESERESERERL